MSRKKCSKCKNEFECCNETNGCWCESVKLDDAALNHLKKEFEDCLCPTCLKEFEKV